MDCFIRFDETNYWLSRTRYLTSSAESYSYEQNPETQSRWPQMARSGKMVMQFLSEGRYVANVVDGKVNPYDI